MSRSPSGPLSVAGKVKMSDERDEQGGPRGKDSAESLTGAYQFGGGGAS